MRFLIPVWILLLWGGLTLGQAAESDTFKPDLSQARELITGTLTQGGPVQDARIPEDATELRTYPLSSAQSMYLLSEVPGKPFRPTTPAPQGRVFWKYPVYVALGLPRDMVDTLMGGLSYVPIINIPLVYVPYELVPMQFFFRDSRDWHKWPGARNERDHGMTDGSSWGWFPNAHTWHFTSPSFRLARKNAQYNEAMKAQLAKINHTREAQNQSITSRTQETRTKALAAVQAGNGKEAAMRMIPYHRAYPLDEGAFALYATALALYVPEGPRWVAPVMWHDMSAAQARALDQAEKLLATTAKAFPERPVLVEALIYTRLLLDRPQQALEAAQALLKAQADDPLRRRLVFEIALAADDTDAAKAILDSMNAGNYGSYDANDWQMMAARLNLLKGEPEPARQSLAALQQTRPGDPYLSYYYGLALLATAEASANPAEAYRQALAQVDQASLQAPNPALRARAAVALSYLRGIVSAIQQKPEAFTPSAGSSK